MQTRNIPNRHTMPKLKLWSKIEMNDIIIKIINSKYVLLNPIKNSYGLFEKGVGMTKADFPENVINENRELITIVIRATKYSPYRPKKIKMELNKLNFQIS